MRTLCNKRIFSYFPKSSPSLSVHLLKGEGKYMTSSKNKPGAWHWDKDAICYNPHSQKHPWEAVVEEATLISQKVQVEGGSAQVVTCIEKSNADLHCLKQITYLSISLVFDSP